MYNELKVIEYIDSMITDKDELDYKEFMDFYVNYYNINVVDYKHHLCMRICIDYLKGDNFYDRINVSIEYGGKDKLIEICNIYKRYKKLQRIV